MAGNLMDPAMKPIPRVLLVKAHVPAHTRKDGTQVRAYDTRVQARTKPAGQRGDAQSGDLFAPKQDKAAWARRVIHNEDHMPWRDVAEAKRILGIEDRDVVAEFRELFDERKAKQKGQPAPEKDWRDEENWHTRTQMRMRTLSDDALHYIVKDATEAAEAAEKMGSRKAGQYRDEAHYASDELYRRRRARGL
jgi:hypothetical protein